MWYNQKGQPLTFTYDSNSTLELSQFRYDKDGYNPYLDEFDPQQKATQTAPSSNTAAANTSGGGNLLDSIFALANTAGGVWTSANQASTAKANAATAQANANAIYGGQRAGLYPTTGSGMSAGMKVGLAVAGIGVVALIIWAVKKTAAAPAAPAA